MSDQVLQSPNDPEDDEPEAYVLGKRDVAAILYAVEIDDREKLIELMEPLHAADIADLLEQISSYDRAALIRLYGLEFDGEILSELDEGIRDEVVSLLTPEVLQEAMRELDSDDVVDIFEDLDDAQQATMLGALDAARSCYGARTLDRRRRHRPSAQNARGRAARPVLSHHHR